MTVCMLDHLLKPHKKSRRSSVLTTPLMWWYGRDYHGTVLLPFIFVRMGENIGHCVSRVHSEAYCKALKWYVVRRSRLDLLTRLCGGACSKKHAKVAGREHSELHSYKRLDLGSPDLNLLDYKIWDKLQEMACAKPHLNLESLKLSLEQVAANFPIEMLRKVTEQWPEHLQLCIEKEGDHMKWYELDLELFPLFKYIYIYMVVSCPTFHSWDTGV